MDFNYAEVINQYSLELLDESGIDEVLTSFCLLCLEYENEMYAALSAFKANEIALLKDCNDVYKITNSLIDYLKSEIMLQDDTDNETVKKKLLCVYTAKKYLMLKDKYKNCVSQKLFYRE